MAASAGGGRRAVVCGPLLETRVGGVNRTKLPNCLSGLDDVDSGVNIIAATDLAEMPDKESPAFRATRMG